MITKSMVALHTTQHKECASGRLAHITRVERFWRENRVNTMKFFKDEFQKLETLG